MVVAHSMPVEVRSEQTGWGRVYRGGGCEARVIIATQTLSKLQDVVRNHFEPSASAAGVAAPPSLSREMCMPELASREGNFNHNIDQIGISRT